MVFLQVVASFCLISLCQSSKIYFKPDKLEPCESLNGRRQCVDIDSCPPALQAIQHGRYPKPCDFKRKHPYVCCDSESVIDPGIKSAKQCHEFFEKIPLGPDGNKIYDAIKGPQPTITEDEPHMAALGVQTGVKINWVCAGTLISRKFILTAASCLQHSNGTINLIRLGDYKLNTESDTEVQPQNFRVARTLIHPEFEPPALYHDIALIELDRPVKITKFVTPACLQTTKEINEGLWLVSGYQSGDDVVDELYVAGALVANRVTCEFYFEKTGMFRETLPKGFDEEVQICSGGTHPSRPCQRDIGGPLVYANLDYTDGRWIIGVTSLGTPCTTNNAPGLYTRVSYYIPWIESNVWP